MFSAFHTRCTMRLHKCTIAVLGKNFIEMSNKTVTSEERKERRYQRRKAAREAKRREKIGKYDDFERVASLNSLYEAATEAAKGVTWKASVQRYHASLLFNISNTRADLLAGKDIRRGFICFTICERGKLRNIKSVHFSERVVQKSFCTNVLYPTFTRGLIYDNGASQEGKGTHFALRRLKTHLRRHFRKYGREGGILLIGFSDYFGNAQHEALFSLYDEVFTDPRIIALGKAFISAFGEIGLGLGSETSQLNAVRLPNKADHYAKEVLRLRGYARFMDDTYAIHQDIKYLEFCLEALRVIYADHGIIVNEKKTKIVDLKHGFTYLKTRFYITETGRIIAKPCRESITRERRKLKKQAKLVESGVLTFDAVRCSYASHIGSLQHRNAYRTIQSMNRLFNRLFIEQWKGDQEHEQTDNEDQRTDRGRDQGPAATPHSDGL